jgi:16S rRNA (cytosine967-C5)-methyltransferase
VNEREQALLALLDMELNAAYSGAAVARRTRRMGGGEAGYAAAGEAGYAPGYAAAAFDGGSDPADARGAGAVAAAHATCVAGAATHMPNATGGDSHAPFMPAAYAAGDDPHAPFAPAAYAAADGGSGMADARGAGAVACRSAALVRELVYGATKWKLSLDHIIFTYSKLKRERVAPPILNILRLGAYQLVFMDRIPASAACNESVKLAKKYGNKGSAAFANAILRRISADCAALGDPRGAEAPQAPAIAAARASAPATDSIPTPAPPHSFWLPAPGTVGEAEFLSLKYSYPPWICERWLRRYGSDFAGRLMRAGNERPELTIRANRLRASRESLIEALNEGCFGAAPGVFSSDAIRMSRPSGFPRSPLFIGGLFTVQDESSMLCAIALGARDGDRVLDMCAAPGGKSGYLAELTSGGADILACDIYEHRLALMERSFQRLGHMSIKTALLDATRHEPGLDGSMDRVLLDAPCSGLGLIRKKPEIKWAKTEGGIAAMARAQLAMLENAARYAKIGGDIVYSVCTTEPDEGEAVVERFLAGHQNYRCVPLSLAELAPSGAAKLAPSALSGDAELAPSALSGAADIAARAKAAAAHACAAATATQATAHVAAAQTTAQATAHACTAVAQAAAHTGAAHAACPGATGLRLFPHTHGVDGFFIAKLRRSD